MASTTTTPRYVVQRVGDQFVPMRQDELDTSTSALFTAAGIITGFWGLKHRGLPGLAAVGVAACLFYRGATGRNLIDRLTCATCGQAKKGNESDTPSHQHQDASHSNQKPDDAVDEAAMESFPASDPPARSSSTGAT